MKESFRVMVEISEQIFHRYFDIETLEVILEPQIPVTGNK